MVGGDQDETPLTSRRLLAKHQKQEGGMGQVLFSAAREPALPTIDLRLLAPKLGQCVSPVYSCLPCGAWLQQPQWTASLEFCVKSTAWSTGARCPWPPHLLGLFPLLYFVPGSTGWRRNRATYPMTEPLPYHQVSFPAFNCPLDFFWNHRSVYFCPFPWVFPKYNGVPQRSGSMLWPHTCLIRQVVRWSSGRKWLRLPGRVRGWLKPG